MLCQDLEPLMLEPKAKPVARLNARGIEDSTALERLAADGTSLELSLPGCVTADSTPSR